MGCCVDKLLFKNGMDNVIKEQIPTNLWELQIKDIDGNDRTLKDYTQDKKVFIFVNVACKCGLTSDNYTQLQEMYQKYRDEGLQILGFPCGQFMNQELSTESEIRDFVAKKFEIDFPMFNKIEVNGEKTHPIYKYLKSNSTQMNTPNGVRNIPWNFGKFLVNKEGKVISFFGPRVNPIEMLKEIEELLKK